MYRWGYDTCYIIKALGLHLDSRVYRIWNADGSVLDLPGGEPMHGQKIITWPAVNPGLNQLWRAVYKEFHVPGLTSPGWVIACITQHWNGQSFRVLEHVPEQGLVQFADYNGSPAQIWYSYHIANDFVVIRNTLDHKCLVNAGTGAQVRTLALNDAQLAISHLWRIQTV